jgi:hypothetical protein
MSLRTPRLGAAEPNRGGRAGIATADLSEPRTIAPETGHTWTAARTAWSR